jgi:hypothetical protein
MKGPRKTAKISVEVVGNPAGGASFLLISPLSASQTACGVGVEMTGEWQSGRGRDTVLAW